MENDNRIHICYVCDGEGATMWGDCPNCGGTGVLEHFREEEKNEKSI